MAFALAGRWWGPCTVLEGFQSSGVWLSGTLEETKLVGCSRALFPQLVLFLVGGEEIERAAKDVAWSSGQNYKFLVPSVGWVDMKHFRLCQIHSINSRRLIPKLV